MTLVVKQRLDGGDISQIRGLETACIQADGVRVKFNWELMLDRSAAHAQGFCWCDGGRIVGYAALDGGGGGFEVTGAVLPAHRRRGILRRLFAAAQAEVRRCGGRELLLVSYPDFPAGAMAARSLGGVYKFSEYRMEAGADAVPPLPESPLRLEEATTDDVSELSRTLGLSFGDRRRHEPERLREALRTPGQTYFFAKVGAETVGQIGTGVPPEGAVYLRAVGILPQWRRRGYGRQMLAAMVHRLMGGGHRRFALDVETDNAQALSLYQACGFHQVMAYEYSRVPLA